MEKRTPHCSLDKVKALVKAGKVRSTFSALAGGAALGIDFDAIVNVVLTLTLADFYKSMTTHANHRIGRTFIGLRHMQAVCISS